MSGSRQDNVAIGERTEAQIEKPRMFNVVLHNDDYTPISFVVAVLTTAFNLKYDEAERLAAAVHKQGTGGVGPYTLDVAQTRANNAAEMARACGHPLRCSVCEV